MDHRKSRMDKVSIVMNDNGYTTATIFYEKLMHLLYEYDDLKERFVRESIIEDTHIPYIDLYEIYDVLKDNIDGNPVSLLSMAEIAYNYINENLDYVRFKIL